MPASTLSMASPSTQNGGTDAGLDPLAGVDHIIVIDNGAHNIRIASIPYPFPPGAISSATTSTSVDPALLAQTIAVDVFPNAIARTRTPHIVPASTSPTAPAAGTKTSIFVSSHIHTLLDDYAALHLRLPHQSGVVVDWAAQKTIWDHVLTNHLARLGPIKKGAKLLAGKAVIITETYNNLEPSQHAIDLLMLEQYGAQALWRTTPASLVGLGTDVFRTDLPPSPTPAAAEDTNPTETEPSPPPDAPSDTHAPKRPLRTPRTSTLAEPAPSIPRLLPTPRPECMLVLDLGYSYCHAVPLLSGIPHYPSVRRLELGGKMLINLLKETLSFQQLDMMDESWLMSHLFARTAFVAAEPGRRVYGSDDKLHAGLETIRRKPAAEWSYNDLLLLCKYPKANKGKAREKVGVTWSLPDYGGSASAKGGQEARDRARYGFIVDGPNPPPYPNHARGSEERRKRIKRESLREWESSFIATSPSSHPSPSHSDDDDSQEDQQTLQLDSERFSIVEHLFNPHALSLDQQPLPELVLASLTSVAASVSQSAADMMWSNIVLVGGLANVVGMRRRLTNELAALAPSDVPVRLWPREERGMDASLIAIQAGVGLACDLSAKEALRERSEDGGRQAKGSKKKGRARISRAPSDAVGSNGGGEARWMTYAQWMNPAADGDAVRAANAVFYPTPAQDVA